MSSRKNHRLPQARASAVRGAAGRRIAERKAGRFAKIRVTPAMVGALVLMAAGIGTAATATGAHSADLVGYGWNTTTSSPTQNDPNSTDVSRSFDRPALARQAKLQAAQRARALRERDGQVRARLAHLRRDEQLRNQWVLPVVGYTLTGRFGDRSTLWSSGIHTGLDFAGPSGTKIVALAAGTVKSAGYSGSYGNRTVITLADGTEIWYCHQSRIIVKPGDKVIPGQLTGYTGATGNVTGPHLHLEVRPPGSGPVDPAPALRAHGVQP